MAKPNDTRIARASNKPNRTTPTNPTSHRSTRLPPPFIALLQTLLAHHASAPTTPVPPKSARPPSIKPRRRVTVSASPAPANGPDIPWIRLCGRWLAVAGFDVHTHVRVHVAQDIVILIPEDAD